VLESSTTGPFSLTHPSEESLEAIGNLHNLQELHLIDDFPALTDRVVRKIASRCPHLRFLNVAKASFGYDGLAALGELCPALQYLVVYNFGNPRASIINGCKALIENLSANQRRPPSLPMCLLIRGVVENGIRLPRKIKVAIRRANFSVEIDVK
jgi:hypothetical protein